MRRFKITETRIAESGKSAVTNVKLKGGKRSASLQTKWRYSTEAQTWLMYDLVVEGVSLLQTQQKELTHQFAKLSAMDVIDKLKKV